MAGWDCKREVVPFAAMAAVEFAMVGTNTLYKAATLKGLSCFVLLAYSYVIALLALFPLPSSLHLSKICRSRELPPFTISAFCWIILAALLGMENLDMRSSTTRIKIIGILFSISGAFVAVMYKGPTILSSASSSPSQLQSVLLKYPELGTSKTNWVIGGLLLVFQKLGFSFWYMTKAMNMYPDARIVSILYFLFKTVIALPICSIAETKSSAWILRPDLAMLTIILSGLFGPAFSPSIHSWGLLLKGPLYIAIFKPLSVAIAAAFGVIFLGEALLLGSVVGATILLLGFYAVICRKAQEEDVTDYGSSSDHAKTPLLQGRRVEDTENNTCR